MKIFDLTMVRNGIAMQFNPIEIDDSLLDRHPDPAKFITEELYAYAAHFWSEQDKGSLAS